MWPVLDSSVKWSLFWSDPHVDNAFRQCLQFYLRAVRKPANSWADNNIDGEKDSQTQTAFEFCLSPWDTYEVYHLLDFIQYLVFTGHFQVMRPHCAGPDCYSIQKICDWSTVLYFLMNRGGTQCEKLPLPGWSHQGPCRGRTSYRCVLPWSKGCPPSDHHTSTPTETHRKRESLFLIKQISPVFRSFVQL